MADRKFKCKRCERIKVAKPKGPIPKQCDDCYHGTKRSRDKADREAAGKRRRRTPGVTVPPDVAIHRFAAWLHTYPSDIEAAARAAGLDIEALALEDAVELAEMRHAGLVAGDAAALDRLMFTLQSCLAISSLATIEEISPRDRVSGVGQVARARQVAAADGTPQYAEVIVHVDGEVVS